MTEKFPAGFELTGGKDDNPWASLMGGNVSMVGEVAAFDEKVEKNKDNENRSAPQEGESKTKETSQGIDSSQNQSTEGAAGDGTALRGLKGDRPRVERIMCEVCDIWTSGPINYHDHLKGKAHARNLLLREQGVKVVGKVGVKDRRAKIARTLQEEKEPLIGLQFLVEFQDDDPRVVPKYVCNLCEDILERKYVISHCHGKSHRYKYLQQAYPEKCTLVSDEKTKAGKQLAAEKVAKEVMELEGGPQLDSIKVSLNIDPFGPERKAVMRHFGQGPMGGIIEQVMENGITFSDIVPLISCCEINNPDDATAALQVSNIISQKILEFNSGNLNMNRGGFRGGRPGFGPRFGHRGRFIGGGWYGRGRGRPGPY